MPRINHLPKDTVLKTTDQVLIHDDGGTKTATVQQITDLVTMTSDVIEGHVPFTIDGDNVTGPLRINGLESYEWNRGDDTSELNVIATGNTTLTMGSDAAAVIKVQTDVFRSGAYLIITNEDGDKHFSEIDEVDNVNNTITLTTAFNDYTDFSENGNTLLFYVGEIYLGDTQFVPLTFGTGGNTVAAWAEGSSETIIPADKVAVKGFQEPGVDAESGYVADWAEADSDLLIPGDKMPDIQFGDQHTFDSLNDRNAGLDASSNSISWHPGDRAIVAGNVYLYVGVAKVGPTLDSDWNQLNYTLPPDLVQLDTDMSYNLGVYNLNADININNVNIAEHINHTGDSNNRITFGTDTITLQTSAVNSNVLNNNGLTMSVPVNLVQMFSSDINNFAAVARNGSIAYDFSNKRIVQNYNNTWYPLGVNSGGVDGTDSFSIGAGASAAASDSISFGHEALVEDDANDSISIGAHAAVTATQVSGDDGGISIGYSAYSGFRMTFTGMTLDQAQNEITFNGIKFLENDASSTNNFKVLNGSELRIVQGDLDAVITVNGDNTVNATSFTMSFVSVTPVVTLVDTDGVITLKNRGEDSIAIGSRAVASSDDSLALGDDAQALAENSISVGGDSKVNPESNNSIAIGVEASVSGAQSLADDGAIAIGFKSITSGEDAIAIGTAASATASDSLAIGDDATSSGVNSIAIGPEATATHANAIALGEIATTKDNELITPTHLHLQEVGAGIKIVDINTVGENPDQSSGKIEFHHGQYDSDNNLDHDNIVGEIEVLGASTDDASKTGEFKVRLWQPAEGSNSAALTDRLVVSNDTLSYTLGHENFAHFNVSSDRVRLVGYDGPTAAYDLNFVGYDADENWSSNFELGALTFNNSERVLNSPSDPNLFEVKVFVDEANAEDDNLRTYMRFQGGRASDGALGTGLEVFGDGIYVGTTHESATAEKLTNSRVAQIPDTGGDDADANLYLDEEGNFNRVTGVANVYTSDSDTLLMKVWSGPTSALPSAANRDTDTIYFVTD